MNASKIIKGLDKATTGRKTYITVAVYLANALFGDKVPFLRDHQMEIDHVLNFVLTGTMAHKVGRKALKLVKNIKLFKKD